MSKFNENFICPVFQNSGKCDEQDALKVMEQFRDFYESKLQEIENRGGGDCLEMKLKIQRRWIDDLTEQTQMMARIVKELEDEATTRVRMLEDKLRQTSKCAYEVMKRYQTYSISHNLDEPFQKVFYLESDLKNLLEFIRRIRDDERWSIDGLQFYDVTYKDLFGIDKKCECKEMDNFRSTDKEVSGNEDNEPQMGYDFRQNEDLVMLLKQKSEEYEELKKSMLDMRSALTEEVACKHDMISALKKDIQQLEERCVQSDKQTAFKDDIIKELRKELKQIKQQSKEKEAELSKELEETKAKLKRVQPCIDRTTCTDPDFNVVIKKSKLIQNKDDIIQIQTDTLNVIENELQAKRKREKELEDEIAARKREVDELKRKCAELEKNLLTSQTRAENLQKAVDLYNNSINVLEAAKEKATLEIEQQKITIKNLQEALVCSKKELDDFKQNNQQDLDVPNMYAAYYMLGNIEEVVLRFGSLSVEEVEAAVTYYQYLSNVFYVNLIDMEERNKVIQLEVEKMIEAYRNLQDCNFDLEIEHFNALQDLAVLETQLHKYQQEFEESRTAGKEEIKKLQKQNHYYEHVIDCFKKEMAVMSEQLANLQDILNLSNQSCRDENSQLYNAVIELQKLSEKLHSDLIDSEKQALLENQKNQLKDAKIDELQGIIDQKNRDLTLHDEAINEIKNKFEQSLLENHELQNTIAALNTKIAQLKCRLQNEEAEKARYKSKNLAMKKSCSDSRCDYERKPKRVEFQDQEALRQVQKELERTKEKNKEKIKSLKRQNEELKDKLATSELKQKKLAEQAFILKEELTQISHKDCSREHELTQAKQIIIELRQNLIELNESLAESELHQLAMAEEYHKLKSSENINQNDLYLSCRCEIALYKKLAENFKSELLETNRKISALESSNKSLSEELKHKELKFSEIEKRSAKKEREAKLQIEELSEELRVSQEEEKRLSNFIETLKVEIQRKIQSRQEKVVINCCDCNTMSNTHEEIDSLKIEIRNMIENQMALNSENDKLLKQVNTLQSSVNTLEEKNTLWKQKYEKLQSDYHKLKEKNKILIKEKESLLQTLRGLEMELAEAKNNQDDLCAESRIVVNNVKAWLDEQRKINEKVMRKTQCYCTAIQRLKEENESLIAERPLAASTPQRQPMYIRASRRPTNEFGNVWNYEQESDSVGSPRNSPDSCPCSVEEWYSPNYRVVEDETDSNENAFLQTLEAVTQEMRHKNIKWKRCREQNCVVSRDNK